MASRLVVVTGKGGVGKSTVAAALGLAAARAGGRAIVVEVAARADVPRALGLEPQPVYTERRLAAGLHHLSIDPDRALEDYLRLQLHARPLAGAVARNPLFAVIAAVAPGLQELLTIGKAWELAARPPRGSGPYDLVVVDAPATGHALALLESPATFAALARVGRVARQAREIARFLGDPARTGVVGVAAPAEMAVVEALELDAGLRRRLGRGLDRAVVNGAYPRRFSRADERVLRAAPPSPARRAALLEAAEARRQRVRVRGLRRGLGDAVPLTMLPFLFEGAVGPEPLARLAAELRP